MIFHLCPFLECVLFVFIIFKIQNLSDKSNWSSPHNLLVVLLHYQITSCNTSFCPNSTSGLQKFPCIQIWGGSSKPSIIESSVAAISACAVTLQSKMHMNWQQCHSLLISFNVRSNWGSYLFLFLCVWSLTPLQVVVSFPLNPTHIRK